MKATTIKTLATTLITLALTSASFAQTSNVFWTGNQNFWGGSPHNSWSTTAGGSTYMRVNSSSDVNMTYDAQNMVGTTRVVNMNRDLVKMRTLTFNATGTDGFSLVSGAANGAGVEIGTTVNVLGGQHNALQNATAPKTNILGANSTWTIAANAGLLWGITIEGSGGIIKEGLGTLVMLGDHLYTGNTVINAGAFGVYGGNASLAGNLSFASGADLIFSDAFTLSVAGNVSFAGPFGVGDLLGLDSSVTPATYDLISGTVDFNNIQNVGLENAVDLGGGKLAYFQSGSLQLVVVPEPSSMALAGLGLAAFLMLGRRMKG